LHDERRKAVLVSPEDPNLELVARNNLSGWLGIVLHNQPFAAAASLSYFLTPSEPRPPFRLTPEKYLILLHPGYEHGVDPVDMPKETLGLLLNPPGGKQLSLPDAASAGPRQVMDANYFDPVRERLPQYAGRWLAGLAPVGNTEMVVIVQQRYEEAIPSDRGTIWSGAAMLLGALLILAIGWFAFQWLARPRD